LMEDDPARTKALSERETVPQLQLSHPLAKESVNTLLDEPAGAAVGVTEDEDEDEDEEDDPVVDEDEEEPDEADPDPDK